MIRIVVVDDHEIVRRGLSELLSLHENLEVVGVAENSTAAVAAAESLDPDVLIVDQRMPGGTGIDVVKELRKRKVHSRSIILTTFSEPAVLAEAIHEGADGFLSKDTPFEGLVDAIEAVCEGRRVIRTHFRGAIASPEIDSSGGSSHAHRRPRSSHDLTEREREVLHMLASGLNNRDIAHALHCTHGTVKNRVSSVLAKLGARSRTEAVLYAAREGLL